MIAGGAPPTPHEALPPLFAHVLRYATGDHVHTPFGQGVVLSPSDGKPHVQVQLQFGATLYARRGCLVPEFRMLECGEIPKRTRVLCLPEHDKGEPPHDCDPSASEFPMGEIQSFRLREQQYQVKMDSTNSEQALSSTTDDNPSTTRLVPKHLLRFAQDTRVRTKIALGSISEYRFASDTYVVRLDFGGIGYFPHDHVHAVDLRLLSRVPKPMSADVIFQQFQGRITKDDAQQLHNKAQLAYSSMQSLCEQHADALSFLSTNAAYGEQYALLFQSLVDPTLSNATKRLQIASKNEVQKLKTMAQSAKSSFETQLLDGKDVSLFFTQATSVLAQLKASKQVQDLQQNLRAKANSELENLSKKTISTSQKNEFQQQQQQHQKLVLSQLVGTLERHLETQKPHFEKVQNVFQKDQILANLQDHEDDLIKAQETFLYLEKVASEKLGVKSLSELEPSQLIAKAEELLPQLSARAEILKNSGEKYLTHFQQTSQGKALFLQAKQLVQSVENPTLFCENVQNAISDVQLDKLALWGTSLTTNRQKRQEFIDSVKNNCLDFFMSVLPSIKVDTITGLEEGIEYSISKLDLSNFKVKKDRVKVRMGNVADEELFTVRATHLTALLKGFQWTFAQKYFPYAHGGGLADAELSGGIISLGFKAEKRIVNVETGEFKPTLVLNSMEIEIRHELKISVQGSWFSAIYNALTSAFATLIRDYLAKTMESKLLKHMIKLLTTLNLQMDKYWPLIFQLLDIRVEDLPSASAWRGAKELEIQPHEMDVTVTQRDALPFQFAKGVLNKYVVVSRVVTVENSDGKSTDSSELNDLPRIIPIGASVLAINGLACHKLVLEEFKLVLETLPLPYTVRFSLFPEDTSKTRAQRVASKPEFIQVVFKQEGPFGLRLRNRPLAPYGAIVLGFAEQIDGKKSAAELSGKICPGQLLLKINDVDLRFKQLPEILNVMKETTKRPVTLYLANSPDGIVKLREWPPMIEWEQSDDYYNQQQQQQQLGDQEEMEETNIRNYVEVAAFLRVPSFAQKSKILSRGDILWKVNDVIMITPTQTSFTGIMDTLKQIASAKKPMKAVFIKKDEFVAKMNKLAQTKNVNNEDQKNDDENGEILDFEIQKVVVFPSAPLGILFGNWKDQAAYIRVFISSAGPAERSSLINYGQAVLQICGQNVPLDATPAVVDQMIQDAPNYIQNKKQKEQDKPEKEAVPPLYTITLRDLEMEREIMKK